jgi:hypothetical protein
MKVIYMTKIHKIGIDTKNAMLVFDINVYETHKV